MTQSVPAAAPRETWWRRLLGVSSAPAAVAPDPASFADVVWSHHRWQAAREEEAPNERELLREYRRQLAAFEAEEGTVVEAYWCTAEASGLALTSQRAKGLAHPFRSERIKLHRVTDWATGRSPDIAELLHRCDTYAIKSGEVLSRTSRRIVMQWLFALEVHLLGYVERKAQLTEKAKRQAQEELRTIVNQYRHDALHAARMDYVRGMALGLLALTAAAVLSAFLLWRNGILTNESTQLQYVYACYAAGAIGAVVSVLQRMALTGGRSRFTLDYELSSWSLVKLGAIRPLLGAVFGLAALVAVQAGVFSLSLGENQDSQGYYYLAIVAFLAGFSERFTKVIFGGVQQPWSDDPENEPTPAAAPTKRT